MEPVSAVIGIAAAAVQGVRDLINDIQNIRDAHDLIIQLRDDLIIIEQQLNTVKGIPEEDWNFFGPEFANQAKHIMQLCSKACQKFQEDLARWTRHSKEGQTSFRDRLKIGIFGQNQIATMSAQIRNCKLTLTSMVSIMTLYSTSRQGRAMEDVARDMIFATTQVRNAIATANNQLPKLNEQFQQLRQSQSDDVDSEDSKESAIDQNQLQQETLNTSIKLLQELLEKAEGIKATASNTSKSPSISNTFGDLNGKGFQIGTSYGNLTITF